MDIIKYIENQGYYSNSDIGLVRKANEDSCGTVETPNGYLFVVCDGMGGHVGGATASKIAVDSIINFFISDIYQDLQQALYDSLCFANAQIFNTALNQPELKGMGTTACIALIKEDKVWFAHVGDSRIYLYTNKKLHRITKDHSFVQGLVDQGMITDAEAEEHPNKNRILKALGIKEKIEPEVSQQPLIPAKNDVLMLCSDGLNGMVNDPTMQGVLASKISVFQKGEELIKLAKQAGGKDNITVQLIDFFYSKNKQALFISKNPIEYTNDSPNFILKNKSLLVIAASVIIIISLGVIGLGTYWVISKRNPHNQQNTENSVETNTEDKITSDKDKKSLKQKELNSNINFGEIKGYVIKFKQAYPPRPEMRIEVNSQNDAEDKVKQQIRNSRNSNYEWKLYFNGEVKSKGSKKNISYVLKKDGNSFKNYRNMEELKKELPEESSSIVKYEIVEIVDLGEEESKEIIQYEYSYKIYKNSEAVFPTRNKNKSFFRSEKSCYEKAKEKFNRYMNKTNANYHVGFFKGGNFEKIDFKDLPKLENHSVKWRVKTNNTTNKLEQIYEGSIKPDMETLKKNNLFDVNEVKRNIEIKYFNVDILGNESEDKTSNKIIEYKIPKRTKSDSLNVRN